MKTLNFTRAVFIFLIFTASANAQSGVATLTKDGALQIEAGESLQNVFSIDASEFNFKSEYDAIQFFAEKQTDNVTFRPVFDRGIVMVYLQTKKNREWTINQWNAYLSKHKILSRAIDNNLQPSKN